ncbi:acyltransferase domain-containing protein [Mesorhizobium sp. YC-39]|uniref:acyltransferase domain-containing protein n=1 Tax=unclassified Mesorhizobium TaxID=325217 RepID=UPI0021E7E307|nr:MULTISPECIES: acyltransferase domain-containing protein [unclassified Mesorhizobium]MCV3206521.1 acyltransferase domain-containing protein [Mesorhizobium sp. YC-2]MCV3227079.1 acyltransferase domain-containing protein [Mesorhizobium sp. YC-39]
MSSTAILCSGQGRQSPEMFDLVAFEPAAAAVFAAAARALGGRDARDLVREGGGIIQRNGVAQVLCCTAALATWAIIGPSAPRPRIIAGYSAGEVPAWAVAGVMDASSAFDLVARRAAFMDEATREPSGLAAIVGLPRDVVDGLCRAHGLDVAIVNGPLHVIVGGRVAGLRRGLMDAAARGATRATILPIHVASHTPALEAAAGRFGGLLRETVADARLPREVRLISGIDGTPVRRIADGLVKLAAQVATTIDWAACMDACRASRPARVLELGPGDALARMMTEFEPGIPARSAADFRSITGLRRWMEAAV